MDSIKNQGSLPRHQVLQIIYSGEVGWGLAKNVLTKIGVTGIQKILNTVVFDVLNFSIIFGIIGQLGDFLESMIKRELNVKDSGTILQRHGGVLDRMDSLILAAPCYYIYLKFIMGING